METRWKFSGAETVMDNQDLAEQRQITSVFIAEMTLVPSQDENPRRLRSTAAEIHLPLVSDIFSHAVSCLILDLGMELCQCLSSPETSRWVRGGASCVFDGVGMKGLSELKYHFLLRTIKSVFEKSLKLSPLL
jgi:hypothetical protein